MMSNIPKIVILGAGYAGVLTALRLQKELNYNEADVTLVNKHDYHYFTTQLHMPAAGTEKPENTRVNISKLIDEFKIDFVKSTVVQIRPQDKKVILEDGTLSYDYLVIGLGGEPETFGIPGLQEHAMTIRSINSVRLIREHIEYQFAKFKRDPHRQDYLTFIVGGAGFTGIEFLGELTDRLPDLCKYYDVDPSIVKVINIEAAQHALPAFDSELVEYAIQHLLAKGVIFKFGTSIKECTADGVIIGEGEEIKASTIIWTGGIRGNRLISEAGLDTVRGRVQVDEYLRYADLEHIYVLGDNSIILKEDGTPYPPTAQMAMQQGVNCALNLVATIRNQPLKPYQFSDKGTVASLGKGEAVGLAFGKKYVGKKAYFLKKLIDIRYLFIIGGITLVLKKGKLF